MRRFLFSLALVGAFSAPAFAQSVVQDDITGQECWNAGQGPGGPGTYLCSDTVRNSASIVVGTMGGSIALGVQGGVYQALADGGNLILTAQPTAGTITLPPNPVPNGAVVGVCNPTAAPFATNVVTVAGASGQTSPVNATLTTLAAGSCGRFQFQRSNTSWYRVQ